MDKHELEEWGQKANKEYAGIVSKLNNGKGRNWNVFQTYDIFTDCDVLFVGLNPRANIAIKDESGKLLEGYDSDFSHIDGILRGQWVSQKVLADGYDEYRNGKQPEEYGYFFDSKWKILKGLRFGNSNSFFTEVVRRGTWKLINYYPFCTNNKKDLEAELKHLPKADIQMIRELNLKLYDILNPKLIVFLGINTLKTVISDGPVSEDNCHKEGTMYVGEIAKRRAISIRHTSWYYITDEENRKIADMLGVEVGNLNIGEKNVLNAQIIKDGVVNRLKLKVTDGGNPQTKTTRFELGKTLELTVTSTQQGYVALRHIRYKGNKVTDYNYKKNGIAEQEVADIRAVLSRHAFQFKYDVWLGTKSFAAYGCPTEDGVIKAIVQEIGELEKELGKY